jgi:hypothetical protein
MPKSATVRSDPVRVVGRLRVETTEAVLSGRESTSAAGYE